jgi:hypothetical protein
VLIFNSILILLCYFTLKSGPTGERLARRGVARGCPIRASAVGTRVARGRGRARTSSSPGPGGKPPGAGGARRPRAPGRAAGIDTPIAPPVAAPLCNAPPGVRRRVGRCPGLAGPAHLATAQIDAPVGEDRWARSRSRRNRDLAARTRRGAIRGFRGLWIPQMSRRHTETGHFFERG